MTIRTMLAALLLASCARVAVEGAPDCPEGPASASASSAGSGGAPPGTSSSSASAGGAGGEGGALDACYSCPGPRGLCRRVGCSYEPVGCLEMVSAPGDGCASGVGRCDTEGNCVAPGGVCKPSGAWSLSCSGPGDNAPCDDGNPCTVDACLGSYCDHQHVNDGTPCGDGWACNWGACCEVTAAR